MSLDNPFWLLTLPPILAAILLGTRSGTPARRGALAAACALLVAMGAAGFLLRDDRVGRRHVLVVDRSDSVLPFLSPTDLEGIVREHAAKFNAKDRVGLVLFGREAVVAEPLMEPGRYAGVDLEGFVVKPDGTDPGSALELASSMIPHGSGGEILLVSDGRNNGGEPSRGIWAAAARGIAVHAAPAGGTPAGDFGVESLEGPGLAAPGVPVALTARIASGSGGEATILFRDGEGVPLGDPIRAEFLPGETRIFTSPRFLPPPSGEPRYTVHVTPLVGRDPFPENDEGETVLRVSGARRALLISGNPSSRIFGLLLERLPGWKVTRVKPAHLGEKPVLDAFDLVVLDGVSAPDLGESRMRALEHFVMDGGGGMVLLGGPAAFGLGGYFDTPVERASPVRCDPEEKTRLALVLLLDASGSMNAEVGRDWTKFHAAKAAAGKLLAKLRKGDFVAVLPFAGEVILDPELQAEVADGPPSAIEEVLARIRCEGSTSILSAVRAARQVLEGRTEARKHILLLSDGVETVDAPLEAYRELRRAFLEQKVTVSAAVSASGVTPEVLRFFRNEIVFQGKLYKVEEFALLPRDFVEDVTHARGELMERVTLGPVPARSAPGVSVFSPPPVDAYVRTGLKKEISAAAYVLGESGPPLLAWRRYGLGRTLAFTSSLQGDWCRAWLRWGPRGSSPGGDEGLVSFWNAWIRWVAGEEGANPVRLVRTADGLEVRVRMSDAGDREEGSLILARLLYQGREVSRSRCLQEGPELFTASFETGEPGFYRIVVVTKDGGRTLGEGGIYLGSSREMGALGPDRRALEALCTGGGRFWPAASEFRPAPPLARREAFADLSWVLLLAGAGLFFLFTLAGKRAPSDFARNVGTSGTRIR